jgi:hypothetical protein
MKKIYNRTEYVNGDCDFDTYYGQFVTPELVAAVARNFGPKLLISTDPSFNDIRLSLWDCFQVIRFINLPNWKAANGGQFVWSPCDNVCISKTAAKQWLATRSKESQEIL